jgi:hypothetical protein
MPTELTDHALGSSIKADLARAIPSTTNVAAMVMARAQRLPRAQDSHPRRRHPLALEIAMTIGIMAGLLIILVAGHVALSRSHGSQTLTRPLSGSAPVANKTASASQVAPALACTRLQSPYGPRYGTRFDPPGATNPRISCAQVLAPLHCPAAWTHTCFQGSPPTVVLLRVTTSGLVSETPSAVPSFRAKRLLVWQVTWVPKVCPGPNKVNSALISALNPLAFPPVPFGVAGVGFTPSPCGVALRYYLDATTGKQIAGSIW